MHPPIVRVKSLLMWHRKTVVFVWPPHRRNMSKKEIVDALEFKGGYALISTEVIEAVIVGYRNGEIKKDELRIFAARAEKSVLHSKSKVDLSRILNSKSGLDGVKRLRSGVVKRVGDKVDCVIASSPRGK